MKKILIDRKANSKSWIVSIAFLIVFSTQSFAQIQTNVPVLKNVDAKDFYIGCILSYKHIGFKSDSAIAGQSAVVDTNGGHLVKF